MLIFAHRGLVTSFQAIGSQVYDFTWCYLEALTWIPGTFQPGSHGCTAIASLQNVVITVRVRSNLKIIQMEV